MGRSVACAPSSRVWAAQVSSSTVQDDSVTGKGASGGTGATTKEFTIGEANGALHAVGLWPRAATVSGNFVPPGDAKTTTGGCTKFVDQLQAGMMHNLREGLGLATPDSPSSESTQGNRAGPSIPPDQR